MASGIEVAENHPRPLRDVAFGDRKADPLGAAGDHRGPSVKQCHERLALPEGFTVSNIKYDISRTHATPPRQEIDAWQTPPSLIADFRDILDATRQFIRSAVMPRELEIMADNRVPDDIRDQAKEMGLFGYAIPQEWGGLGLNIAQDVEMAMEFGYTTLALRSMFGTNNGIAGQVLVGFGTDEQKTRWLEGIASGEVVASFALTEPGAGSNPAGLRTKAVRGLGATTG